MKEIDKLKIKISKELYDIISDIKDNKIKQLGNVVIKICNIIDELE